VAVARAKVRLRRARHIVLYWRESRLVVHNYATGRRVQVTPPLCQLLDYCGEWRTLEEIATALDLPEKLLSPLTRRLVSRALLERSDRREDPRALAMGTLDRWNPEAGLFHTATKDVRFWSAREAARQARLQARHAPMPEPIKRYRGAATVDLPRPARGPFAEVLLARRTWRRFSARPLSLDDLATLLGLSVGVQQWARSGSTELALKTSPSGGARHPIECYVAARDVQGLRAGIYHYAADRHALERVRGPVPVTRLASYYPSSGYFAKAPAHVFLTAVFARQLWRYPYSRAYRAALAEAGHVCQTFCLTATALGLAPFCLMGLADSLIERDLGIDGITESILYAAGVGHRPKGALSAPLVRGTLKTRRNPRM
jgi:SagB-type dehydrogenase family enzyme